MSRKLLLRILDDTKIPEGIRVVPVFEEDYKYLKKLPRGEAVVFTAAYNRRGLTNAKLWALMTFTLANLPERFDDELGGKTVEHLYVWLKYKVGFTVKVQVDGKIHETARSGSFDECPDEREYMDALHDPALAAMAWLMGYATVQEFEEASKAWQTVKNT
jgi:hypothetical protein